MGKKAKDVASIFEEIGENTSLQDQYSIFGQIIGLGELSPVNLGPKEFKREVKSHIKKILSCDFVYLYQYDKKKNNVYRNNYLQDGKERIVYEISESSFVGSCAHYKSVLHITDIKNDIRFANLESDVKSENVSELIVAPMVSSGNLIGIVMIGNFNQTRFSKKDHKLLGLLTNQLSISFENYQLFKILQEQFLQVVQSLVDAIGKKDSYTGGHTKRVSIFSEMIAHEMDFTHQEMSDLKMAAALHDIGKIGIEDSILKKRAPLTDEEFKIMREHPRLGHEILGHIDGMINVTDGMRYHHERPDGKGYPYGMKGDDIPLIASVISVADTFDAMISTRPYRKGLPPMVAYEEILKYSGTQFDSKVVDAFVSAFKKTKMYKEEEDFELNKKAG